MHSRERELTDVVMSVARSSGDAKWQRWNHSASRRRKAERCEY
ncbi:hypothetical protein N806_11940 [Rhodococcus sp. P27]|nr:hypothetical protein N806_11940 [Rhodococcus sp. P27]